MLQLEGFKSRGSDEKKDEVTHIGMFRRRLAQSFGHLRSRPSTGPTDPSAAGERSQTDLSSGSSSTGAYRDASAQNLAEGPVTDGNLATGPNPAATAAKLKVGPLRGCMIGAVASVSPGTCFHHWPRQEHTLCWARA